MKYTKKAQFLHEMHEVWLSVDGDMQQIEPLMNDIIKRYGLSFFTPMQIDEMYFIPNIQNVQDAMYLHMNTSCSNDFQYFAVILESFINMEPLIAKDHRDTYHTNVFAFPATSFNPLQPAA